MKQTTLYVSDMDGTLLGADSQVSEHSRNIISDLSEQGALITVATARTPATVKPLLQGTLTLPPAIVMTGAALWNRRSDTYADVRFMPPCDVDEALRACAACDIHPFVYTLHPEGILEVYHDGTQLNRAEQNFYDQRRHLSLKRFHLRRTLPEEARCRTVLLCALGRIAHTDEAASSIRTMTECAVHSYPDALIPEIGILEIFAPGVSKADAIKRVASSLGASRIVAFGDNLNDLPMFAMADVAVAVGNALPEVREAADTVIGPNTSDSVARFIREDFLAQA